MGIAADLSTVVSRKYFTSIWQVSCASTTLAVSVVASPLTARGLCTGLAQRVPGQIHVAQPPAVRRFSIVLLCSRSASDRLKG